MLKRKVHLERGRDSGKTLARQLIAIGTAMRDIGEWVTFFDHVQAPKMMGRRWALMQADHLRGLIALYKIGHMYVRTNGNLVQLRYELPPVMTDDEIEALGMSRLTPNSDRPHSINTR